MKNEVKFERILTEDQIIRLQEFGKTFDHSVDVFSHPIMVAKNDTGWKGYFQIIQTIPIVFPAFHPNCSPREVHEIFTKFKGWAQIQYGGGIVAVPTDSKTFTPAIMDTMNMTRMHQEIYETSNA